VACACASALAIEGGWFLGPTFPVLFCRAARHFLRVYAEVAPLSAEEIDLIPAIAIAESADLFWWRIFQVAEKGTGAPSVHELEEPFKSLRWYNDHRKEVARALRA
jgi:Ser/Thr protein kinase RdoA (MazF antagonist)